MEKKESLRNLFVLALSIMFALVSVSPGFASEFSADMIQKMRGQTQTGKIFIKGKKMRMELNTPQGKMVHIVLPDENKTIMLMTEQKMYMEMVADKSGSNPPPSKEDLEKKATLKSLGTETVNGYPCEKYAVIYNDKTMGKTTQWISKQLNYPVKMVGEGPNGEFTTEYTNIKEGGVSDSMFQIPPGYRKMEMPGMGTGMPQGHDMRHPMGE